MLSKIAISDQSFPQAIALQAHRIFIWTDGSFHDESGTGGWAAKIKFDDKRTRILLRVVPSSKCSDMEVVAAAAALEATPSKSIIVLKTDCETICAAAASSGKRFIRRKNGEIFRRFYRAIDRHLHVEVEKVRAHSGDPDNDEVDQLAKRAVREGAARLNIPVPATFGLKLGKDPRIAASNTPGLC